MIAINCSRRYDRWDRHCSGFSLNLTPAGELVDVTPKDRNKANSDPTKVRNLVRRQRADRFTWHEGDVTVSRPD